ncbi:MAG: amidohydrolase family protein [Clostridia bacterium]|nr:amidohydrolase family protein [Clostridia bacterium]
MPAKRRRQRTNVSQLQSAGILSLSAPASIARASFSRRTRINRRIFALCEAAGLPVLVHTGDQRFDCSNPNRIVNVLRTFPKLKFVGAHFGGWSMWDDAANLFRLWVPIKKRPHRSHRTGRGRFFFGCTVSCCQRSS